MVMVIHPFNRRLFLRMNKYDKELIVDNPETETIRNRSFGDLARSDLLTRDSYNISPYTRDQNVYRETTATPEIASRRDRFKRLIGIHRYHER